MEGGADMELTSAQKAAQTRRKNLAARKEKRLNKEKTISALEKILQDEQSSQTAKENALLLLAMVYRRY